MAMLKVCGRPGCGTLTLGELCIEHEQSPAQRADRPPVRVVPAIATAPRIHRRVPEADGRPSGV
jgi:hypothetical protein